MNPPTPPGSPKESPVNKALPFSASGENKTSSTREPSAGHEIDLDMALFNKAITEQLDSAFQIHEKDEASALCSTLEASGNGVANQAKVDDGPRHPDCESEALVQGLGSMEIGSKEPESSIAAHANHVATARSDVAGHTFVDMTSVIAVDASKASSKAPAKTSGVTVDEDLGKIAKLQNDKAQDDGDAENAAGGPSACGGKKPAKIRSAYPAIA